MFVKRGLKTYFVADEVKYHGKTYYDVSEMYGIRRPLECKLPEWKIELEQKGKVYYGIFGKGYY